MATFSLCVKAGPNSPGSLHGLEFAKSCIEQGHNIVGVFFYGDGVYLSLNTQVTPQGEVSLGILWQEFLLKNEIEAVVCIAAGIRRGVLDQTEADRQGLKFDLIRTGFVLSGLGQWIGANSGADCAITFG
jgi:tRNA 2-thiouridine synthesizing protein D